MCKKISLHMCVGEMEEQRDDHTAKEYTYSRQCAAAVGLPSRLQQVHQGRQTTIRCLTSSPSWRCRFRLRSKIWWRIFSRMLSRGATDASVPVVVVVGLRSLQVLPKCSISRSMSWVLPSGATCGCGSSQSGCSACSASVVWLNWYWSLSLRRWRCECRELFH